MTDVVVKCFAEEVGAWDWGGVSIFLIHSGCFTSRLDGISAKVAHFDSVGNDLFHFV